MSNKLQKQKKIKIRDMKNIDKTKHPNETKNKTLY